MELLTNQTKEEINKLLHNATKTQVKNLYYFFQSFLEPVQELREQEQEESKQEYINKIFVTVNNLLKIADWQLMENIYIAIIKLEKIKEVQKELNKRKEIEEKAINLMAELKFDEANKLLNTLNESDNFLKNFLDE